MEAFRQIEDAAKRKDMRKIVDNTKTLEEIEKRNRLLERSTEPKSESIIVL
jgi:hypothetical protein